MKTYKSILMGAAAVTAALPIYAIDFEKPKVYGLLSAGVQKSDSKDFKVEAFELEIGLQGKAKVENLDLHYAVEIDLAAVANEAHTEDADAKIHVKEAKFWLPTRYGTFVVAPRGTSGQWHELYGAIDHYEYNEPHAELHEDGIFAQPDRTSGTFAYQTPKYLNTKMVLAAITLKDSNDRDLDGRSVRLVYDNGRLGMGIGTTILAKEQLPADATDDYQISAFSVKYNVNGLNLGAVWEHNKNSYYPHSLNRKANFNSYGVSAYYVSDSGAGIALGFKEKIHDYKKADETVYTLKIEQELSNRVKIWAETGQYDVLPSNYAIGFNVKF